MKYFQLFEQFLNEDSLKINESLEDDKKMLSDLDNKIEEVRDRLSVIRKKYTSKGDYTGADSDPDYKKEKKEFDNLSSDWTDLNIKIKKQKEGQKEKEKGQSEPESEEKSDYKLDNKQEEILSKIEKAEDVITDDLGYEFRASPSNQIRIIISGGDKAKESIKKYKQDISEAEDGLEGSTSALSDAKIEGDKQEIKLQTARIELYKAEIELFNAIAAGNIEGLITPLKKIAKFSKTLDKFSDD